MSPLSSVWPIGSVGTSVDFAQASLTLNLICVSRVADKRSVLWVSSLYSVIQEGSSGKLLIIVGAVEIV